MAIYPSPSGAAAALDIRGSDWNTGVLGNPAATRGVDRDDDDDGDDNDETLSGKGILQEHGRRDEVAGRRVGERPEGVWKADRRGKRAWKSGGEDRRENCVARGSQSGESTTNARRQTRSGRRNTRATGTRKFRYRRNGNRIDKRMRDF